MKAFTLALSLAVLSCNPAGTMSNQPDPNQPNDPNNPNNPSDMRPPGDPNTPDLREPIASIEAPLKNGTRLHNKYINGADGSVALGGGLYDTQLAVDCTFMLAEDGMQRCLPTGGYLISTNAFLDSSCTQKIGYSGKCFPAVKYILDSLTMTCGATNRIYNATELTTPPATVYFLSGTTCTGSPNPYGMYRIYSLGSAVAASQFVAGTPMN